MMQSQKTSTHILLRNFYLLTLLFLSFSTSCNDDDDNTDTEPQQLISGFWKSPASGYVLEIKDDGTINQYGTSSAGCVTLEENIDLESANLSLTQTSENELFITSPLITGKVSFSKLTTEEQECATSNLINSNDPGVNYHHFWTIFNEYYSSFEIKNIDWSIYQDLNLEATEDNLYDLMKMAITTLSDGHVSIFNETVEISPASENLIMRLNEFLEPTDQVNDFNGINDLFSSKQETIISNYINEDVGISSDARENLFYGVVGDNIGYLYLSSMRGFSDNPQTELEAVDVIMDEIISVIEEFEIDKIIIDARFNSGGYDGVSLAIASRFFDQERTVFTKFSRTGNTFGDEAAISVSPHTNGSFTGEIVLLTSPFTISAAEIFTLAMKTLPHVTIVGQNTNGAFSDILTHKLPNGTYINLSNQIYTDPDGINFEGIGIGPVTENIVPFFKSDDFSNGTDGGLDKALELLEN